MADEKKPNDKTEQTPGALDQPGEDERSPDDVDGHRSDDGTEDEGGAPVGADATEPDDEGDSGEAYAGPDPGPNAGAILGHPGGKRLTLSEENLGVVGTAVLHYESRSVTVVLDGDAGVRLLYRVLRGRQADWVTDRMHPVRSSARDAWLVLADPAKILAVEWYPGISADAPRGVAIDPAV